MIYAPSVPAVTAPPRVQVSLQYKSPLYCVPLFYCRHRGLWPNPWPLFMARNASIQAGGIKPNRCGIITLPTTRLASGIGCFALQEATILFLNGLCMAILVEWHL